VAHCFMISKAVISSREFRILTHFLRNGCT
jgi:hypothetical protein